jgi:hypothetical protein
VATSRLLVDFEHKSPARNCSSSEPATCNLQLLSGSRESSWSTTETAEFRVPFPMLLAHEFSVIQGEGSL